MSSEPGIPAGNIPAVLDTSTMTRLVGVVTLLLVMIMAARSPVDSDLWWHLRAGEEMLRSGQVLLQDTFSYTRAGAAWINHSWLSEVLLAGLYQVGGFQGLGLWVVLLTATSMGLVYFQLKGSAFLRAFLIVLASTVAAVVWTPRPQLASLALFALTGFLLYLYKWRGRDYLWAFLPLFVLWSNLHGGYPLGLMLAATMIAGEVLNHLLGSNENTLSWRKIGRLALWTVGAFLVVVINPNGVNAWLIPFKTVDVGMLQQVIQEWASPDFHQLFQQPFLVLLFGTTAALALSGRRADGSDLVPFILFAYLALIARRNFGPFAVVAAPVLSRSLIPFLEEWRNRIHLPDKIRAFLVREEEAVRSDLHPSIVRGINLAIVALLGLVFIVKFVIVTQPVLIAGQVDSAYPVEAVAYIQQHRPSGRLFNAYNWGGYLDWKLPNYPVFVDGRTDLFGDEIIGEWMTVIQGGAGWQDSLDRWGVNLVLIEPDRPLVRLLGLNGWKLLSQDTGYVLYGR